MRDIINEKTLPRAASPEETGVDSGTLLQFFEACKKTDMRFKSIMILRHGKVAAACTKKPYRSEYPHTMFSFAKPITAIAACFAMEEGLLSLDTKLSELFSDMYSEKDLQNIEGVTIRHLLTMTAGKKVSVFDQKEKAGWLDRYIKSKPKSKPGEKYLYISEAPYALGRAVCKAAGMGLTDYLTPRLFKPLDIERPFWETDHDGYEAGGWGLYLTIEDMAKIAQCFLDGGLYKGKQVIPANQVKDAVTSQIFNLPSRYAKGMGYGYHLWCGSPTGYYRFEGLYGQVNLVYPDYDACIAVNGSEVLLKKILDTVDAYFPKAFQDGLKPADSQTKARLDAMLDSFSAEIVQPGERKPALEKAISGRVLRTKHNNPFSSMMPVCSKFTLKMPVGKMDHIQFSFHENTCTFAWQEYQYANAIEVSLDGQTRMSEVYLGDVRYHVASYGAWQTDGTFLMQVFPMELSDEMTFRIRFTETGAKASKATNPKIGDLVWFRTQFDGIPYPAAKALGKICSFIGSPIISPGFRGRFSA